MSRAGTAPKAHQGAAKSTAHSIELRCVRYEIGGKPVVNDVTATLRTGEFVCLLGANGAGKSTLVRLIANELKPTSGNIICSDTDGARTDLNDAVAFLPSDLADPPFLTVGEVVALARWNRRAVRGGPSTTELVTDALEMCGALEWRDRKFNELSGGEKERAWLAFAFMQDRPFLLLDESLHAIDFNAQRSAFDLLATAAAQGRGILLVTHQLHMATAAADRLWVMNNGQLVYDGPPKESVGYYASMMQPVG